MLRLTGGPRTTAAGLLAAAALLAACDGGSGTGAGREDRDGEDERAITVWTLEDVAERIQTTQQIIRDFTEQTGIEVDLVAVAEDQFNQLVTSAAAAGELPDVIGALSLAGVHNLGANDLLDTDLPGAIVDQLGRDTFADRALELTTRNGALLGVPSDGWPQLLIYRRDLLDQAGLDPPDSYQAIQRVAASLSRNRMVGITAANVPSDVFTQQTFEHVALANNCRLVSDDGDVRLDSPECTTAFTFYANLLNSYSITGPQDVDTTRDTYFAGRAAMLIWSSFILDEMAGLRADSLPTCPECRTDPAFLAKNSGIVSGLRGPDGEEPAQYGEIVSWVVTATAAKRPATTFVEWMMSDGYVPWLALAPEGKVPTRRGTPDAPQRYLDAWSELPAGVDTKRPLAEIYPAEVLEEVRNSVDTFNRWGFPQGQGDLVGAIQGELPVAQQVSAVTTGGASPEQAARAADEAVTTIAEGLP